MSPMVPVLIVFNESASRVPEFVDCCFNKKTKRSVDSHLKRQKLVKFSKILLLRAPDS